MLYYYPRSAQSPLFILLINILFIPISYSHSSLSTGLYFTVLVGIFIWMYSCKMFIVDLYVDTLKVYVKDIMHCALFCFLASVFLLFYRVAMWHLTQAV